MDACSEATWVCHVLRLCDFVLVDFWQTIYIVVARSLKTEVLCQVNNLDIGGNLVLFEERFALAVAETEEHHIHLVERHIGYELHIGLTIQSFVDICEQIARVALAVDKYNFGLRMIDEQTNEFACRISRTA